MDKPIAMYIGLHIRQEDIYDQIIYWYNINR